MHTVRAADFVTPVPLSVSVGRPAKSVVRCVRNALSIARTAMAISALTAAAASNVWRTTAGATTAKNAAAACAPVSAATAARIENVKNSTVKPTERFREEGVGREPFSKGVSSDILKCSSCRNGFGKILSALFHGRKSSVGRVDPSQVVVMDVSVNHALYLIRRHFCRIHLVQLLLVAKKLSILALS